MIASVNLASFLGKAGAPLTGFLQQSFVLVAEVCGGGIYIFLPVGVQLTPSSLRAKTFDF